LVDATEEAPQSPTQPNRLPTGWVWILTALLLLILLLLGNRWSGAPRSFYAAWDQGHIIAFALWTAMLLRRFTGLTRLRLRYQLAAVLGFALIFGVVAEALQTLGGNGPPSLLDMSRNLLGALTGWAFFSPGMKHRPHVYRWLSRLTVVALLCISILPLARALFDDLQAQWTLPVLAAFDQPFELDRWSGSAHFEIVKPAFAPTNPMLKIDFKTTKYSGVALEHFSRDWRGYQGFSFKLYNPAKTPLAVVCRINDSRHNREGYHYEDRFNRRLSIPPGWVKIDLTLEEIASSLAKRRMEMDDVLQVGIFTIDLPAPRTLYLDDLRLIP
jgi:hypothetical protein